MSDTPSPPQYPVEEQVEAFDFKPIESTHTAGISVPVTSMLLDEGDDAQHSERKAEEVQAAYGVKPYFWKQIQLAPFAIDREGDWMQHRSLLGAAPLGDIIRLGPAMVPDALRVLWFLAHDPAEWLSMPNMKQVQGEDGEPQWIRLTSQERALELETKIRAWAAQHVTRDEGPLAVNLFYDIFNSAHSTQAIAKPHERRDDQKAKN